MLGADSYYQWAVTLTRGQLLDHVLEIEARFRNFVRVTLKSEKGQAWQSAIPGTIATGIRARRPSLPDLLEGADLGELEGIVLNRWAWFQPILGEKPEFKTRMDEFRDWRNALAHGHTPSEDEKIEIAFAIRKVGQKIPPEEAPTPAAVSSKGIVGRRILWCDDRPESTLYLRRIFGLLGVEVFPVLDNAEAEQIASEVPIDLVISDIDRGGAEPGIALPTRLHARGLDVPVYFYVTLVEERPLPEGAVGITNDPTALIRDVLGHLSTPDDP